MEMIAQNNSKNVLEALKPKDEEIKAFWNRLNGNMYTSAGHLATQYILRRLDLDISEFILQVPDWKLVQIEHLFPQKPNEDWKGVVFDAKNDRHKLGNLALLSGITNRECSNASWKVKLRKYRSNKSGHGVQFTITTDAMKHSEWSRKEFSERHEDLLKRLKKLYGIEVEGKAQKVGTGTKEGKLVTKTEEPVVDSQIIQELDDIDDEVEEDEEFHQVMLIGTPLKGKERFI
ncbi:hypothetical protein HDV00_010744 [Rhizophlyctis rosea]|nr:hypothetical protein HDV00_010744 [Rhizophlyctis rosea]